MTSVTEDDEGKRVVDMHGETIGVVKDVRSGSAFVDPDPGITDRIKSRLGWEDADAGDYELDSSHIESITDDEITVRQ